MSESIVSKDLIREQADAAAARWVLNPSPDKPANPYHIESAPDAYREWQRQFEMALVKHTAQKTGEGEA